VARRKKDAKEAEEQGRTLALTITAIKNAPPPKENEKTGYILWDTEVKGLGCRISPKGKKTFVVFYRTLDGTQRKPRIEDFGAITLDKARKIAQDILAEVRAGGDPSLDRAEARKAPTLAEVCDRYLKDYARPYKKPLSVADDIVMIDKYIKPSLGSRKVASLAFKDVERLHRELGHIPIRANRVRSLLSKMFNLCEKWGLRPQNSNPCRHVGRYKERQVHRPMTEPELTRLSRVMREAETGTPDVSENPRAIAAIRLLLFTGCRRNEVLRLRWDEVDLQNSVLRLHDSKTGEKLVRLNTAAREVLEGQAPLPDNPWVFPSDKKTGQPIHDVKGPWARIRARAGLADVRLHDLRHNFAATGAAGGLSLHQIGQLLGHRSPRTTARYSDLTDDPARRAAEQVGEALAGLVDTGKSSS
jgi:integrase